MNRFKKAYNSIAHMMKGRPTPRKERRNVPAEEPAPPMARTVTIPYEPSATWYTVTGPSYSTTWTSSVILGSEYGITFKLPLEAKHNKNAQLRLVLRAWDNERLGYYSSGYTTAVS